MSTPSIVIWGDGGGSTFRATIDALYQGKVDGFNVSGVVTTSPSAGILEHVKYANSAYGMNIASLVVAGQAGKRQDIETQATVLEFIKKHQADSLVLMGAMVIMGELLVRELNGEVPEINFPKDLSSARQLMIPGGNNQFILPDDFQKQYQPANPGQFGLTNTHPAPSIVTANTHGLGAQKRLLRLGSLYGGPTYHVVAPGIDNGPVLAFEPVDISQYLHPKYTADDYVEDDIFEQAAQAVFESVQRVEKANLPHWVAEQIKARTEYLQK